MRSSVMISIIMSYAMILIPGCKQRIESNVKEDNGVYSQEELARANAALRPIDHKAFFSRMQQDIKQYSVFNPLKTEQFSEQYGEYVYKNTYYLFGINPKDLRTRRIISHPQQINPKKYPNEQMFIMVPDRPDTYFQVQAAESSRSGRSKGKLKVTVHEDTYGNQTLEQIDYQVSNVELEVQSDQGMKETIGRMVREFKPMGEKYMGPEKAKGMNLRDDEELSTYKKMQVFFGIVAFGVMTFFIVSMGYGFDFGKMVAELRGPVLFMVIVLAAMALLVTQVLKPYLKKTMDELMNGLKPETERGVFGR